MSQNPNTAVVDAALASVSANPADTVALPAAEVLRLRELEKSHADLEMDTSRSFIDRDLADALKGHNLLPGSEAHLVKLWKDDFKARRIDGRWVVEATTGGGVAEVVKSRLESGEFNHFLKAGSTGGANATANRTTATVTTADPDAIVQARRQRIVDEMGLAAAGGPDVYGGIGGFGGRR